MTRTQPRGALVVLGLLCASVMIGVTGCSGGQPQGGASSATPSGIDLTGTWIATKRSYQGADGARGTGTETLTIGPVQDFVFDATREITVLQPADFGHGRERTSVKLQTFGVVNPDGSLTIVKDGDDGRLHIWPVDDNTIEAVYTESGEQPYVVRQTMVRQ